MNVSQAKEIIGGTKDAYYSTHSPTYNRAAGFLEAVRQLSPAVEALKSISENTCCDKCQEAAAWAKSALASIKGVFE